MTGFLAGALLIELCELEMAASYQAHGMNGPATFDLFVHQLPTECNLNVTADLGPALEFLERFHFGSDALACLRSPDLFKRTQYAQQ